MIIRHTLSVTCNCQTVFNFFLGLIILHSKGFCSFHVLWQLNNNLYSTIKMNKNPDNINRYLSSLRRFASLKEILQNHEKTSWFSLSQLAVDKKQKTRQFLLSKAAEGANCLRFAGSTISRYRPYSKRSNSLLKSLALQQRVSLFNSLKSSFEIRAMKYNITSKI